MLSKRYRGLQFATCLTEKSKMGNGAPVQNPIDNGNGDYAFNFKGYEVYWIDKNNVKYDAERMKNVAQECMDETGTSIDDIASLSQAADGEPFYDKMMDLLWRAADKLGFDADIAFYARGDAAGFNTMGDVKVLVLNLNVDVPVVGRYTMMFGLITITNSDGDGMFWLRNKGKRGYGMWGYCHKERVTCRNENDGYEVTYKKS